MSGTIHGSAPWGRQVVAAIPPDKRAVIEDAIPDGHFIAVGCRTSKTDLSIRLMKGEPGSSVQVAMVEGQTRVVGGVEHLLYLYAKGAA